MTLSVPLVGSDDDTLSAAFGYAAAGWYVVPVSRRDRKNPGSRVGKGWQHQTSRDGQQITAWWAGSSDLLALHCGRSGAVVFDVDNPELLPDVLRKHLHSAACPPHQSSRPDQPGRGHYVFAQPPGRMIGNSVGKLPRGWGEVRGKNGVIIVAPSRHAREADGARYEWLGTGSVPVLPDELAALLPDATDVTDAATDDEVARFVAEHQTGTSPGRMQGPLTRFVRLMDEGASRHESLVEVACWAARESMVGTYSAETVFAALTELFVPAMATSRNGIERTTSAGTARAEAAGVIAWAVAQAELEGPEAVRERVSRTTLLTPIPMGTPPGTAPQYPQKPGPSAAPGASEGIEGQSPGGWDLPTPLPGRTDPIPTDALGDTLQPLVEDIAERLQVPSDLPINLALPLISTAAKGAWIAEVEPGWTEPVCIATLSALPSGERKSPTLRLLDAPLRELERVTQAAKRPDIAQQAARRKLVEGRVEELRKKALKALDGAAPEKAYLAEVAKLDELTVETLPRWLVDDATPEKFVSLLAEHEGAIGAVSAEPGLFGILAGRYSSGTPNIEWLLKATSGDPITVDRIGRGPEQVDNPALSIACCIQPGRLVELGKVKAFRESGLLARWLYAVPRSDVGTRSRTRQVQAKLLDAWAERITALGAAAMKRRKEGTPATLKLTEGARDVLELFRSVIEPHLHPDHGKYAGIADWMNKLPGTTVRIAAVLTLLEDPAATQITAATMANSVRIGTAYVSHAVAAFGLSRPNAEVYAQAKQLLAVIQRLCADAGTSIVTRRTVHQKIRDRSWVETSESLDQPLGLLVEYGHIRGVAPEPGTVGRPSPRIELHACHLADSAAQNPQNLGDAA